MKTLRILAFAIVAICFFGSAKAQVVVRARIGQPPAHRRVVVVHHRHYRHHHYHHPVVVRHYRH